MRKRDENKIKAIKDTVIKMIRDYGFHGISMGKIAKSAGISPATIYIYYESKSDMIHEIYHNLRRESHDYVFRGVKNDMGTEDILKTVYKAYYEYCTNHEDEFFFIKQFSSCPCLYHEMKSKDYNKEVEEFLTDLQNRNEIKKINTKILMALLSAPLDSMIEEFFITGKATPEDEIEEMFNLVWKSISLE